MPKPKIIEGDIAAGTQHAFAGDTLIRGQVGAGAQITVTNGTLEVIGGVGDGAKISVKRAAVDAKAAFNACSLFINGRTGNQVKLDAADDLRLRGDAGNALTARADNIYAKEVAAKAVLSSARNIHVEAVGDKSRVTAGARLYITFAGLGADLRAGEIIGASPYKLPYKCPRNSRDATIGRKTTHFVNGNHAPVRLKRWG